MAQQDCPEPDTGIGPGTGTGIDPDTKFVRVTEVRPDGFVAFDFAIGEPGLYVEMLLPRDAFEAFCKDQAVIHLDAAPSPEDSDSHGDFLWRLSDAARAAAGQNPSVSPSSDLPGRSL